MLMLGILLWGNDDGESNILNLKEKMEKYQGSVDFEG